MDVATETLFPAEIAPEWAASADFKLVRLARKFRGAAIGKPESHILIMGALSRNSFVGHKPREAIQRMVDRMLTAREKLISFGVAEDSIIGYLPRRPAPSTGDSIAVTARDTAAPQILPGMRVVPPSQGRRTSEEDAAKGNVVIDPFSDEGPTIDTEIEITVWDDKNNKLKQSFEITLKIGAEGVEEVEGELTVIKTRIKNQAFFGLIKNVELSVKLSGSVGVDLTSAERLLGNWAAELKGSLEFEIHVPSTSIVIKVEGTIGVDTEGNPVPGIQFKFEF
jgi:hypothetical protein